MTDRYFKTTLGTLINHCGWDIPDDADADDWYDEDGKLIDADMPVTVYSDGHVIGLDGGCGIDVFFSQPCYTRRRWAEDRRNAKHHESAP